MRLLNCLVLYCYCVCSLYAQNLVPNHSFEHYVGTTACGGSGFTWANYTTGFGACTAGGGGFNRLNCTLTGGWYEPGGGSTDIYTTCACAASGNGRYRCQGQNLLFPADAVPMQDGQACLWLRYYSLQDYAAIALSSPMLPGQTYDISYWLRLSPRARYRHDGVGLVFSSAAFTWSFWSNPSPLPTPAFPATAAMLDRADVWTQVTGTYTVPAGAPHSHVTIGAWKSYAAIATGPNRLLPDANSNSDADFFFDNLSITPAIVLDQALLRLTGKFADGTPVLFYHTPVPELWEGQVWDLQHSPDGAQFSSVGTVVPGSGSHTHLPPPAGQHHYYRLRAATEEGASTYSQTIYLRMPAARPILLGNVLHSAAQPLRLRGVAPQAHLQLADLRGAVLLNHLHIDGAGDCALRLPHQLTAGMYLLRYRDAEGAHTYRVQVGVQ